LDSYLQHVTDASIFFITYHSHARDITCAYGFNLETVVKQLRN